MPSQISLLCGVPLYHTPSPHLFILSFFLLQKKPLNYRILASQDSKQRAPFISPLEDKRRLLVWQQGSWDVGSGALDERKEQKPPSEVKHDSSQAWLSSTTGTPSEQLQSFNWMKQEVIAIICRGPKRTVSDKAKSLLFLPSIHLVGKGGVLTTIMGWPNTQDLILNGSSLTIYTPSQAGEWGCNTSCWITRSLYLQRKQTNRDAGLAVTRGWNDLWFP